MKIILILIAIVFSITTFSQSHRWRGTNQDGRYPDTNLLDIWPEEGLPLKATYSGMGEGYGSPSIREDGIFIAGMHDSIGHVYKFSHEGGMLWKTEYGEDFTYKYRGSRGTPTLEENRLYYSGAEGDAICLNTETGKKIWHVNIFKKYGGSLMKWGYTESPLLYKNMVILTPGGPDVSMVALDKMTGEAIWEMELEGGFNVYCTPQLIEHNNETMAMVNLSNYLLIFDPENGAIKYKHDITHRRNNHTMEPMYIEGKVLHTAGYGIGSTFYQINEKTKGMDTIWYSADFDCKMSGMMRIDDLIYGTADRKKTWNAINWKTGEIAFSTRDIKPGSMIMADGKFYIFTDTGEIVLAKPNPLGFEVISSFNSPAAPAKMSFSHPVIYNGDLFVRYDDNLWRYSLKK